MKMTSPAFDDEATIPKKYTCQGENINPPLIVKGIPDGTVSLALIMDDPDVPRQIREDQMFVHWVLYDIDPGAQIGENSAPGIQGRNTAGSSIYTGPCPPKQYEPAEHRYHFKLYALDTRLGLDAGATKEQVLEAMEGHVLEKAELMGRYEKE